MSSLTAPVLASGGDPLSHVLPHEVLRVGGYSVPNTLLMLLLAAVVMLLAFPIVARTKDRVPRGARNLFESVLQFLREQVARPALHEATDRFMPFLWTTFFLILIANLIGALPLNPLISLLTGKEAHLGGTATGDFSITIGLAVCAFVAIHVGGIREQGFVHYAKNFAPHVPWPMLLLLVPLEIVAAFVKPFALCIRLFANMIAGHILLAVLVGFILSAGASSWLAGLGLAALAVIPGSIFVTLLEVFVAMLQAFIFTFLTALFIGQAVVFHHGGGHGSAEAHA
jgi:F-type H+-transporting ATPase subunit a